jgi:GNAT superfamily N-acetyltransferase
VKKVRREHARSLEPDKHDGTLNAREQDHEPKHTGIGEHYEHTHAQSDANQHMEHMGHSHDFWSKNQMAAMAATAPIDVDRVRDAADAQFIVNIFFKLTGHDVKYTDGSEWIIAKRRDTGLRVGCAMTIIVKGALLVYNLIVMPDARKCGVGSALFALVIDSAKCMGMDVCGTVSEDMRPFYEKFGARNMRHDEHADIQPINTDTSLTWMIIPIDHIQFIDGIDHDISDDDIKH